jgi:NlpC/P60 family
MSDENLTDHQKNVLRKALVDSARLLLGIPYVFGAEWADIAQKPDALDCSELVEGVFKQNGLRMPDGSQSQFDFTVPTGLPKVGDLGFFARGGNPKQVYHVGMIFELTKNHYGNPFGQIVEARAYDPNATFETGKVILRSMAKWESYIPNFLGWRAHPKLI